jgi:hypothetical protein
MAPPIDQENPVESNTSYDQAKKEADDIVNLSNAINNRSEATEKAATTTKKLQEVTEEASDATKKFSNITQDQANKIGMASVALFGYQNQFENLGKGMSGMSTVINDVFTRLSTGPGVVQNLVKMGMNSELANQYSKQIDFLKSIPKAQLEAADSAMVLENNFISLAAETGTLDKLFADSGPNLQNLANLVEDKAMMMNKAAGATGLSTKEVSGYFNELAKIPGALSSVVKGSGDAKERTEMLTAAIKLSHGTARDTKDVIADLSKAYDNYGLKGEDALKFTARFTEIAGKYNVKFSAIRGNLINTSEAFGKFVSAGEAGNRMAEGASSIMNNYVESFKATGITGERAAGIITTMTNSVGNLSLAQKAFLSAQSGGPGGIMGGLQIEKMLQEGNIEGVFNKVKDVMTKQFGKIVTLEEATKSEAAGAQFVKQRAMLMQGPLGGIVKSEDDAARVLEALQKGTALPIPTKLKESGLRDYMEQGTRREELSYNPATALRNLGEMQSIVGGFGALRKIRQGGLTAGGGDFGEGDEVAQEASGALRATMRRASASGGDLAERASKGDVGGEGSIAMSEAFTEIGRMLDDAPKVGKAIQKTVLSSFGLDAPSLKNLEEKKAQFISKAEEKRKELIKDKDRFGLMAFEKNYEKTLKALDNAITTVKKSEESELKGAAPTTTSVSTSRAAERKAYEEVEDDEDMAMPAAPGVSATAIDPRLKAEAAVAKVSREKMASAAMAEVSPPADILRPAAGRAAKVAAKTQEEAARAADTITAARPPTAVPVEVKGTIEGFCVICKDKFDVSHLDHINPAAERT